MATVRFTKAEGQIQQRLRGMATRANSMSAYLNRVLLRQFKKAQIARFESENSSEGSTWAPLSPRYLSWKRRVYAAGPGGGNATMVRTGHLSDGATGRDSRFYYKAVTNTSFLFGMNLSEVPYAGYAGDRRPYMRFSQETTREWKQGIREFITRNKGGV